MGQAVMIAAFSKDPSTQVGSVIVSKDNKPLGTGYNCPPQYIDDNSFSWERPPEDDPEAFSKYDVVTHAERNAINHSPKKRLKGATIYVTGFPCKWCMLDIVDADITRLVYLDYNSDAGSILRKGQRTTSEKIAELKNSNPKAKKLIIEKFSGDLGWIENWVNVLKQKNILPS